MNYEAASVFADYRSRKADNTLKRQKAALALFSEYLVKTEGSGPTGEKLTASPAAWAGVTWRLIEGYRDWLIVRGCAMGTVNVRLSTVKTYAKMAVKAGAIEPPEGMMIGWVGGYSRRERNRIDEERKAAGAASRIGHKKAQAVPISGTARREMMKQPVTPQGRRDELIMCLLLDHGLRCGEVAGLTVEDFDLDAGTFTFWSAKTEMAGKHRLTPDTMVAATAYLEKDALATGPLLRSSQKGGKLTGPGMSERAITDRVRVLGKAVGIEGLSANDCRHHYTQRMVDAGATSEVAMDACGWLTRSMIDTYRTRPEIGNERVKLQD